MAGGTNGGYPVFREYFKAGVDTVLAMHIAEEDLRRLRDEAPENATLLVTGHMATDSIGINQVIAGMEEQGIEVTRTSGVIAP
jgi:phage terminase large subunit-like protein